jgi:hypothetical protein
VFPLLILIAAACWAEGPFGAWKMNPTRSTLTGDPQIKSLVVRIEPHSKGEVFTLDRIDGAGRAVTSSSILYLDAKERGFEEPNCSGAQSSRQVNGQTVEILRRCASGEWIRLVRRSSVPPKELVLEITEQQPDGRRFERRLVLERQSGGR